MKDHYDFSHINGKLKSEFEKFGSYYQLKDCSAECLNLQRKTVVQAMKRNKLTLKEDFLNMSSSKFPKVVENFNYTLVDRSYGDYSYEFTDTGESHCESLIDNMYDVHFSEEIKELTSVNDKFDFYIREVEIENLDKPEKISLKYSSNNLHRDNKISEVDLLSLTTYDDLLLALTPDFMYHNLPCKLSSGVLYSIVRNYIKSNPSDNYRIESDYDFVFRVKKVVKMEPYDYTFTPFGKKKSKTIKKITKEYDLFEIVPDNKNRNSYKNSTLIPEIEASSFKELVSKLEDLLREVMIKLTEEVVECKHCSGKGCHINKVDFRVNLKSETKE